MPVPPSLPKISIPNPVTQATSFFSGTWIIQDIENVFFWLLDWVMYAISLGFQAIFQAMEWLILSLMNLLITATAGLGPLSGPIFLVLLVGIIAFLLLIFDQIVSLIPK